MRRPAVVSAVTAAVGLILFAIPCLLLRQRPPQQPAGREGLTPSAASRWCAAPAVEAGGRDGGLYYAVGSGDIHATSRLLEEGADPNGKEPGGWTALHAAALTGETAIAQLLLQHGADVMARNDKGHTPLHTTRYSREVTELLLCHGADVTARDAQGRTPLHVASQLGWSLSCMEVLLAAGAPVNAVDTYGDTPLLFAIRENECPPALLAVVRALLAAGADVNVVSDDGRTALSLVDELGLVEVAALLRAHGAHAAQPGQPSAHEPQSGEQGGDQT